MAGEKRKRCPNWLPSEKSLLVELVERHVSVVENKKTDGLTMRQKLAEWQLIANEYNSRTTHCTRTADNLKKQWDFMKKNAKKEDTYNRMDRIQTGGIPGRLKKDYPLHRKIISLIKASSGGLFNHCDSDSVVESSDNNNNGETTDPLPEETPIKVTDFKIEREESLHSTAEVDSNEIELQNWNVYMPLRAPVSKPLQEETIKKCWSTRRRPTRAAARTSLQKLHEKKIEAIDLQNTIAKKESQLLNEARELDLEIKRELLKQEKLKTRILLLDLRFKKKQLNEQ